MSEPEKYNWREMKQTIVLPEPKLVTQQDVQNFLRIKAASNRAQRKILKDLLDDLFGVECPIS